MFFVWNDRRIHFVDEGSGPALVFLHGLGGNADNWLNQRRFFARTRRVLISIFPATVSPKAATWAFVVTGTSSKGCSNMLAYLLL
jgi:pimeloyl-ACP methyl ester carboxylesterase